METPYYDSPCERLRRLLNSLTPQELIDKRIEVSQDTSFGHTNWCEFDNARIVDNITGVPIVQLYNIQDHDAKPQPR